MLDLKGCGTALVTPFTADGKLDESALRRFVDFQIENGIDFLVPCGTTGESATLTEAEHLRVIEITIDQARKRVPVIGGAGGNNTAHIIDLAKKVEALGVDGILSVSPYYNKPTQEGLYQHFKAVAASVKVPIVVYNVPGRTAVNILPDTVIRLSAIDNIIAVKEASGSMDQITEICVRVPDGFKVFSGDDSMTVPIMSVGGVGIISVASNEIPAEMTELAGLCLKGDYAAAQKLNKKLFPIMKINFIETSPGPVKAAVAMMGLITESYRLPIVPVQPETRAKLRAVLESLNLIPAGAAV
ncbi:MAG TPA: 4-hydroxy-tetrahydrodipicolinate synthase [Blastocatellia bacterium]|nr:4-hydroxy-tetrahydrodipicolinate synthase [Blastocatellia bacterium]